MIKLVVILVLFLSIQSAFSQQMSLKAGQSFSKLKFEDSQGNELGNLLSVNHFFMAAGYRTALWPDQLNSKLFGNLGLRFSGYGSKGSDATLDNYYEWDLSYLGLSLGLDYEFYEVGNFAGFVSIKVSPELMIRGSQTITGPQNINNGVYDLMGEEDFNTPITFFRGGIGARYQLASNASMFIEYTYGKSYSFFDSGADKLNILAQYFGVGVFADIAGGGSQKNRKR